MNKKHNGRMMGGRMGGGRMGSGKSIVRMAGGTAASLKAEPGEQIFMIDDVEESGVGFKEGGRYSLSEFWEKANSFKQKFFLGESSKKAPEELEQIFWDIVEKRCEKEVHVEYGSDLPTDVHGSGFHELEELEDGVWQMFKKRKERGSKSERIATSPGEWNLTKLPKLEQSLFGSLKTEIPGITTPYLYVGMCFSSFCWHAEDNYLYSISFLHEGSPKVWYGIPAHAADAFEDLVMRLHPELFEEEPDALYHLVMMVNPEILLENDVPVYRIVQEPGDFVITFPRAYHAGFNTGFNCAEAVNFALFNWLEFGQLALKRYRFSRFPIFSHAEMLVKLALADPSEKTAQMILNDVESVWTRFMILREKAFRAGVESEKTRFIEDDVMESKDLACEDECNVCKTTCFFGYVKCGCKRGEVVCLHCSQDCCDASPANKTFYQRFEDRYMRALNQRLVDTSKGIIVLD
eukprot:TRINITY_DN8160_c0_g1_i1.p1 TRINITY_DN8160_c0_g1~~TRINITY_DN8160_c0_g1_i1.p1  ORF type:complete len:463 (-),score=137.30 TRINITY_DN8160_c0_g1_i1:247-1635(-)